MPKAELEKATRASRRHGAPAPGRCVHEVGADHEAAEVPEGGRRREVVGVEGNAHARGRIPAVAVGGLAAGADDESDLADRESRWEAAQAT